MGVLSKFKQCELSNSELKARLTPSLLFSSDNLRPTRAYSWAASDNGAAAGLTWTVSSEAVEALTELPGV